MPIVILPAILLLYIVGLGFFYIFTLKDSEKITLPLFLGQQLFNLAIIILGVVLLFDLIPLRVDLAEYGSYIIITEFIFLHTVSVLGALFIIATKNKLKISSAIVIALFSVFYAISLIIISHKIIVSILIVAQILINIHKSNFETIVLNIFSRGFTLVPILIGIVLLFPPQADEPLYYGLNAFTIGLSLIIYFSSKFFIETLAATKNLRYKY